MFNLLLPNIPILTWIKWNIDQVTQTAMGRKNKSSVIQKLKLIGPYPTSIETLFMSPFPLRITI
uniref:ORF63a n=1 Tax=Pinus koraiensis TaxID=88728 RepID=A4QMI0_PINKO|nr:ORF63a [Pinus koraiensis]